MVKGGHVQTTKADLLKDSSLTKADTRTGLPLGRRSVAKWRRALVTKCTEAKTLAIFVPASVILTTTQRVWHPEEAKCCCLFAELGKNLRVIRTP
jgi:hypothetical protein